jgi:hypothetical protein
MLSLSGATSISPLSRAYKLAEVSQTVSDFA